MTTRNPQNNNSHAISEAKKATSTFSTDSENDNAAGTENDFQLRVDNAHDADTDPAIERDSSTDTLNNGYNPTYTATIAPTETSNDTTNSNGETESENAVNNPSAIDTTNSTPDRKSVV